MADRIVVGLHKGLKLEAVLASDPALPCRPGLRRWRREAPEFDGVLRKIFAAWRVRRASVASVPEVFAEEVADHIADGGSFASFSRLPGGPSRTTLRRWVRVDPDFAAQVARACELREEMLHDQVCDIVLGTPPGPLAQRKRAVGPLLRQMTRLRHRPGAAHRRRGGAAAFRRETGIGPRLRGDERLIRGSGERRGEAEPELLVEVLVGGGVAHADDDERRLGTT